jgi:hypothetical protein
LKQILVLVAVFLVACAATLLVFSGGLFKKVEISDTIDVDDRPRDPIDPVARRQADINRTMINTDEAARNAPLPVEAGTSASPATGEIEGEAKTDDGLTPRDLKVTVYPVGPEAKLLGGGQFMIPDLKPGVYQLGVAADGYLLRQAQEVSVAAGKKYEVKFVLERGFTLAGIVIEDVDQRPIQGVRLDFNGLAHATTDASGAFRTGLTSPKALDIITLTHDDYDRNVVVQPFVPDHQSMTLGMSRGRGTVIGRVIPASGQDAPKQFRVRIIRAVMDGLEELRRERSFSGTNNFEIKGVFDGAHVLEVSFPGTTLASRRIEFDLKRDLAQHFDIDLNGGGTVEGTFTHPANLIAQQPVVLLDRKGRGVGETRTDAAGKFRFEQVPEDDYSIRMNVGIPPINTQSFKVEDRKVATVVVDGQTGRLK